jgi:hypothetical protein
MMADRFLHLVKRLHEGAACAWPAGFVHLLVFGMGLVLANLGAQPAFAAEEMTFRLVPVGDVTKCRRTCPQVIAAEGEITERTPDQFLQFVNRNLQSANLHAVVFIHSPGGKVIASMEFGKVLRRIGAAAVVARIFSGGADGTTHFAGARCFSACVYALMGGKKRVIPPESEVGIHRMFTYETGVDPAGSTGDRRRRYDDGGMASALLRYSGMMGISPGLISEAEHISPDTIHILTRSEITRWHLGVAKF